MEFIENLASCYSNRLPVAQAQCSACPDANLASSNSTRLHVPQAKCNFKMLDAGADCDVAGSISRGSAFPNAIFYSSNSMRLHVPKAQ